MQEPRGSLVQTNGSPEFSTWAAPTVFALLTIGIFGTTLIRSHLLVAQIGEDVTAHVLWWRPFGFSTLLHGHIPFWDPHLASGVPYFGAFQSAMLYPPNWIFLLLPTSLAINWSFALHTFLSGWFMQLWVRSKRLSWTASMLAGAMYMFGGMTWLRIYAGHHMAVCSIPWIPIVFWSIDGLLRHGGLKWCLLGGGAVAMQILAGFPQFIYYTGIAAGLYLLLGLSRTAHNRRAIVGLVAIYAIGSGIAAAQLLAAVQVNGEGPRSNGLDYQTASAGAFVPADALTLACPLLFGDGGTIRNYSPGGLGESSLFIGGTGAVLALLGALSGRKSFRRACLLMIALLGALSLGNYTPLYWPLYKLVPLYGSFRDVGRFNLFVGVFLILLAAEGFDLLRSGAARRWRWWALAPVLIAIFLAAAATRIYATSGNPVGGNWTQWVQRLDPTGFMYAHIISRSASASPQQTARWAAESLASGGILLAISGVLWWLAVGRLKTCCTIATTVMLIVELLTFAHQTRPVVDLPLPYPAKWKRLAASAGTSRITHCTGDSQFINRAMVDGTYEANIYDQTQLTRYKTLFNFAGGFGGADFPPPNLAICRAAFTRYPAIWAMLRLKYVFVGDRAHSVIQLPDPLSQVQLAHQVRIVGPGSAPALAALADPSFDPRETAILESPPDITPAAGEGGRVWIVRQTADSLELRADLPADAFLLITDSYSPGWTARPLAGSAQQTYKVVPADLALRGIALSAGKHHLLVRYRPPSLRAGIAISGLSAIIYLGFVIYWRRRRALPAAQAASPV